MDILNTPIRTDRNSNFTTVWILGPPHPTPQKLKIMGPEIQKDENENASIFYFFKLFGWRSQKAADLMYGGWIVYGV